MKETGARSSSFGSWIILDKKQSAILLRCIPATVVSLFVVSVICMNLLANKTLYQSYWIALDGGILVSWVSFLCMDMITKYFGPRASNTIALLAVSINLLTCFIFYIAGAIPSHANDYAALDGILKGTWFILLGSTIAFIASAVINNFMNWQIGKLFDRDPDGKAAFFVRTYVSTFVGQFLDNLIFAIIVFVIFAPIFWDGFHWTALQCAVCSLTGASIELAAEAVFSPWGYRIVSEWKKHRVGAEYLEYMKDR